MTVGISRGDVFWARLDPTVGSEIQKTRPVAVLSINPLNRARKNSCCCPPFHFGACHRLFECRIEGWLGGKM